MALFSTFLLSNIDSSILFYLAYQFPTLRLELSMALFSTFLLLNIDLSLLTTIDFQPWS